MMEYNSLKHHRGIIQPNLGLYSRWLCGKFCIVSLTLATLVFWAVPWDYFYYLDWYQKLISLISNISPNVEKIPTTENQFPEYSIALITFLGILGPFLAIYSFIYGINHAKKIRPFMRSNVPPTVLLKGVFLSLLVLPIFIWGAYNFTGSTFYNPGLFFKSKPHFVIMLIGCWWGASLVLFVFSCVLAGLFNYRRS